MKAVCVPLVVFSYHRMQFLKNHSIGSPSLQFQLLAISICFCRVKCVCVEKNIRFRKNWSFGAIFINKFDASINQILLYKMWYSFFQGCYMTIHITPEPEFSYVSFESNVASSNYGDLISRVIKLFQPGKFVVTIFANKVSIPSASNKMHRNKD